MSGAGEPELISQLTQARTLGGAAVLALLWSLESVLPLFPGRGRRLSHACANLGLAALNFLLALPFACAVTGVLEFASLHRFGLLPLLSLPPCLGWIAALLLFDCWQYWWHRLNHRLPFLWRFHAVHHADAELDASSGVRFHPVEIALSFGARLFILPLLGLSLPQLLLYETIALPIILFHHANLRIHPRLDQSLRWLIVTPRMHVVHHSRYQPETDSNFSSLLSVWDRLFRSFRLRFRPEEITLGLDHWSESDWRPLPGLLRAPFRKQKRPSTPRTPPPAAPLF